MEKVGLPPSSSGDYSGPGDAGGKGALGLDVGVVSAGDPQGISTHRSAHPVLNHLLVYIVRIVSIRKFVKFFIILQRKKINIEQSYFS